ncbi:unnamed protein product [Callosobruchus maculatus]|uniref:Uncharacterized protein n=1 Tax=Callosobruchus maculatus TaxID=64391 RepID=A0A653CPN5_CALMS|nr:unnamed protein product [Callosobruchus maculatus]
MKLEFGVQDDSYDVSQSMFSTVCFDFNLYFEIWRVGGYIVCERRNLFSKLRPKMEINKKSKVISGVVASCQIIVLCSVRFALAQTLLRFRYVFCGKVKLEVNYLFKVSPYT